MKSLNLKSIDKDTPVVSFDAESGVCELRDQSYMIDAMDFYIPLINWLKEYVATVKGTITFNIRLNHYNTSSSKCILMMMLMLREYERRGGLVSINWFYNPKDSDLVDDIEDMKVEGDLKINMFPI